MRIAAFYTWVPGSHDGYAETFAASYREHPAGVDHDLVVAVKAATVPVAQPGIPAGNWMAVGPGGWDIGPFLELAALYEDYDRVVLLGAYSRILDDGWLGKLVSAGRLASATGSFEVRPHLRTNCLSVDPGLLAGMGPVVSKEDCWAFEHGPGCIYQAALEQGVRGVVVGRDGAYEEAAWATSRTFRQGGQENLICADHRSDHWANADAAERASLTALAGF